MPRTRTVPEELGQKLLSSADDFLASFDDVRMEDIAEASGGPRATLYYYFDGKGDILRFLFNAILVHYGAELGRAVDEEGADTRHRVASFVQTLLQLIAARPATAQAVLGNLGQISKFSNMRDELDRSLAAPVRRVLQEGVERGEVGPIDITIAATTIYSAVSSAALGLVFDESLDVDVLSRTLMAVLWDGIGASAHAPDAQRA